jgi:hypothetical protein
MMLLGLFCAPRLCQYNPITASNSTMKRKPNQMNGYILPIIRIQ